MQPDHRDVDRIASAKTFLFVPGDRPDRFDKAVGSGADIVILDLEDAVSSSSKATARAVVSQWLSPEKPVLVRINATGTECHEQDLEIASIPGLMGFVLPKAEPGRPLEHVASLKPTLALIESAVGVAGVSMVAATTGVERLAFGTIDLALDLDTTSLEVMTIIGVQLVVASRANGIAAPVDGVTPSFKDPAVILAAMQDARTKGFGAKLCIHPAQIEPVITALSPTAIEIARASRIVAADKASCGAAVALDGQMIDKPVVAQAYRILSNAGSGG